MTLLHFVLPAQQKYVPSSTGSLFEVKTVREFDSRKIVSFSKINVRNNKLSTTSTCESENWGVLTTIFSPTKAVHQFQDLSDWCLVIVADKHTPISYALPANGVFLSAEEQIKLFDAEFLSHVPWNHFGRKSVGYLYAVQQGAKRIWDFDDDNYLIDPSELNNLIAHNFTTKEYSQFSAPHVFNPYPEFSPTRLPSWPRGLPLDLIKSKAPTIYANVKPKVGVLQSLANVDPDVDAIFRMTQALPHSFSRASKRVVLDSGIMSPYNAQATLHAYDAFWALLLPITVPGRVSDIWRGYFAQPLLWKCGMHLAFINPLVEQNRSAHNYMRDFAAETDLYKKTGPLLNFLQSWSSQHTTIPDAYQKMWIDMYERGFIEEEDVFLAQAWLKSLLRAGYTFPQMKKPLAILVMTMDDMSLMSRWLAYHGYTYGFDNIYIFDGSVGEQKQLLEQASKRHSFHLIHSLEGLNSITRAMSNCMNDIKDGYDWIIKVDGDEFITQLPLGSRGHEGPDLSTRVLRLPPPDKSRHLRVTWELNVNPVQEGSPTEQERGIIKAGGRYKALWSAPLYKGDLNLGGHSNPKAMLASDICIVHYHSRSYEDLVRIALQTVISHKFVAPNDSREVMLKKLKPKSRRGTSWKKALYVVNDLQNHSSARAAFFAKYDTSAPPFLRSFREHLHQIFSKYPNLVTDVIAP